MSNAHHFHTFHTFHTSETTRTQAQARVHARTRTRDLEVWRYGGMEEGQGGRNHAGGAASRASRWGWVRDAMPRVTRLVAEKRREWGDAHVSACQAAGLAGEPGHFFAREGCIWLGTPWADDPVMVQFMALRVTGDEAVVFMRPPEQEAPCA